VRGAAGRWAFIPLPPQKEKGQNCSAYAPQFFQIITAALFVPPSFAHCKINPQKLGQKSTATQKVKHGIYRKRQKPCLILQKAYKQRRKHRPCFTNNSKVKRRAF
jgi:hypothetical protein